MNLGRAHVSTPSDVPPLRASRIPLPSQMHHKGRRIRTVSYSSKEEYTCPLAAHIFLLPKVGVQNPRGERNVGSAFVAIWAEAKTLSSSETLLLEGR